MKRKIIVTISMLLIMSFSLTSVTFADSTEAQGDLEPVLEEVMDNSNCEIIDSTNSDIPDQSPQNKAATATMWKIESKELVDNSVYGAWTTVDEVVVPKKDAPMNIKCKGSIKYSHSISGTLQVSKGAIESSLGFKLSETNEVSTSITKEKAGAGTWYFKLRPVKYKYKIVQRLYKVVPGTGALIKTDSVATCYVYKYDHYSKTLTTSK